MKNKAQCLQRLGSPQGQGMRNGFSDVSSYLLYVTCEFVLKNKQQDLFILLFNFSL